MTNKCKIVGTPDDINNRDLMTTWVGCTVEVNPWELVKNALENAVLYEPALEEFLSKLEQLQKDVERVVGNES